MANFTSVSGIQNNINSSAQILDILKNIHNQCVNAQTVLNLYQSNPAFKAQADHLFTPAQLAELGQMIADTTALQAAWSVNHKSALGLE